MEEEEGEEVKRGSEWGAKELQNEASTVKGGVYKIGNEVQDEARGRNGGKMGRRADSQ